MAPPVEPRAQPVAVWDLPVRLLHWSLVLSCTAAWLSTLYFLSWHEAAGYTALAVVVARIAWSTAGSRHARLSQFVTNPARTWAYAQLVLKGSAPRYLGHNPLGGWMALAMWSCVASLGVTGWLYSTDMFWGTPWLDQTHQVLGWLLLALVPFHVVGVIYTGRKHHERLVAAMVSGKKAAPSGTDID